MRLKKSRAFTLVEIVIALFITSLVSIALFSLYDRSSRDFVQVNESSELQNEANLLFALIEKDLSTGGFVHPIRGDVSNSANCMSGISANDAVNIVSGTEVSSCFDIPNTAQTVAYRYKVTYKKGPFTGGPDANTLYKKVERTNDCVTISNVSGDPNFASLTHDWRPVSDKIGTVNFTYRTISSTLSGGLTTTVNNNVVDVDVQFRSRRPNPVLLNFNKRVALKNKGLTNSSTQCDNKCPNAKDVFANYVITNNSAAWNPATQTVPSARVVILTNYQNGEDTFRWDTTMAANLGLTVTFQASTGVLQITGTTTGQNYQNFLRTIRYVNLENTVANRTVFTGTDRAIQMALGFGGLCADLIPRQVSTTNHFYCYVDDITNGKGAWSGSSITGNQLWWGEAELQAENSVYYNLRGYLATITSEDENNFIIQKLRDASNNVIAAWFGGSDAKDTDGGTASVEGTWRWAGGPEEGQIFFTTSTTDGFADGYTSWRTGEPNDCCSDFHNNNWNGNNLAMGEHYPSRGGEHYAQFSNQQNGGWWNDLFIPGVTYTPFRTRGYVLEFSSDFAATNTCNNTNTNTRNACVNYFSSFNVVLDDFTYQDTDMLDICLPNP